jgi:sulfate-transporting ATPase
MSDRLHRVGLGVLFATQMFTREGLPFLAALVVGALGSGVVSAVIAIPTWSTRGVRLAILAQGLATVAQTLVFDSPIFKGGAPHWPPALFGWSIDPIARPQRHMIFAFLIMALVLSVSPGCGARLLAECCWR